MSLAARDRLALLCAVAATAEEEAVHHRIRHQVFVREQALFVRSDVDDHDGTAGVIKVLGRCGTRAAGTVRLFPIDGSDGVWQGDRLAVLPAFRANGLGKPLVRFAVATAGKLGGREMIAHIQLANVPFFLHLGWRLRGEPEDYVGVPHQLMAIDLKK